MIFVSTKHNQKKYTFSKIKLNTSVLEVLNDSLLKKN